MIYDDKSHYCINGTVPDSGFIPMIKVNTDTDKYYRVTEGHEWLIFPYSEENYLWLDLRSGCAESVAQNIYSLFCPDPE